MGRSIPGTVNVRPRPRITSAAGISTTSRQNPLQLAKRKEHRQTSSLLEQANNNDNREQVHNRLQKASVPKRHQLADHRCKPLNDLPDQLLADKSPEELYAEAVKNSESVNATVVEKTAAEVADYLRQLVAKKDIQNLLLPGVDQAVWDNYGLGDWYQHSGVATFNTWSPQA